MKENIGAFEIGILGTCAVLLQYSRVHRVEIYNRLVEILQRNCGGTRLLGVDSNSVVLFSLP